jgi:hypothetical protein
MILIIITGEKLSPVSALFARPILLAGVADPFFRSRIQHALVCGNLYSSNSPWRLMN